MHYPRIAAFALLCGPLMFAGGKTRDVHVIVAADGSGDSTTIQHAIDHAPPVGDRQRLILDIRPGVYQERVIVPPDRPRVTFRGTDARTTVITYGMSAKAAGGTFLSATVTVNGADFEASGITFANSFGTGSQAVALMVQADRAVIRKCRLLGWQDTLYAASGRQLYEDSYIEGHVDFIFGNAAAVFEKCEIRSLGSGFIAAESRIARDGPTGYVFDRCRLTAGAPGIQVFLGRPWRPYSRVVYVDCWMGAHIERAGWDNWGDRANEATAWFAESGSSGPGADAGGRAPWSRQLAAPDLGPFQPKVFLAGEDGWNPWK